MSKKKQQKNGFFYYMLDMQQELKQQGRNVPMRDMPVFAGPTWSKLSDAQKQMYNQRAKTEKSRASGAGGGDVVVPKHPSKVAGRRDCAGQLLSVRTLAKELPFISHEGSGTQRLIYEYKDPLYVLEVPFFPLLMFGDNLRAYLDLINPFSRRGLTHHIDLISGVLVVSGEGGCGGRDAGEEREAEC